MLEMQARTISLCVLSHSQRNGCTVTGFFAPPSEALHDPTTSATISLSRLAPSENLHGNTVDGFEIDNETELVYDSDVAVSSEEEELGSDCQVEVLSDSENEMNGNESLRNIESCNQCCRDISRLTKYRD